MAFTAQDQKPDTMNYIQDLYSQIKGLRGVVGQALSSITAVLKLSPPSGALQVVDANGNVLMSFGYQSDGSVSVNLGNKNLATNGNVNGYSLGSQTNVWAPTGVNYGLGNNVRIQKTSATRLDFYTT